MGDCIITYGSIANALKELQGFFKMQPSGDPNRRPEERLGLNVHHFLKCFLGFLTKYSNEPLAFSLHKAQVNFRIVKDNFYATGLSPAADV